MGTKFIERFETSHNKVFVYLIEDIKFEQEDLYAIISIEKKTGKHYVRYGNYIQLKSILKTYRRQEKLFKL